MANSILGSNNPTQLLQQFQQFRQSFNGNPQQMVQQMVQSGRVTQAQLQRAQQLAQQFQPFVK